VVSGGAVVSGQGLGVRGRGSVVSGGTVVGGRVAGCGREVHVVAVDATGRRRRWWRSGRGRVEEVPYGLIDEDALGCIAMPNLPSDVFEDLVTRKVAVVQQFLNDVTEPNVV